MTERLYELIFSGELISGMPAEQVQANVAQLFKASPAQIAHLFSGKRVVLKNSLPIATGKKYIAALKKAGARCQLVDMQTGEPYSETPVTPAPQPTPEPAPAATAVSPPESFAAEEPAAAASPEPADTGSSAATTKSSGTVEPGSEHRVGGRPELEAPTWGVAPSGSQMQDEKEELPVPEPDTDYLSLAPQKGNIVESDNTPPPPAPDTSHLDLVDDSDNTSNDR